MLKGLDRLIRGCVIPPGVGYKLRWHDGDQLCFIIAVISTPILINKLESYTSLVISSAGQFPDCISTGACDIM